jgi:hypothetical protein
LCLHYDIGYNNKPLAILCHVVYATLGFRQAVRPKVQVSQNIRVQNR